MKQKGDSNIALKEDSKEIGVPMFLILDPSGEQTSNDNKVKQFAQECSMSLKISEESTQWANLVGSYISILNLAVCKDLKESNCFLIFIQVPFSFSIIYHK